LTAGTTGCLIVDRALTLLLDDLAKRKFAETERPRSGRKTAPGSRHIPAEVKRAVWTRDGGRCAFVGTGGKRCGSRAFLEYHHVVPWAAGGETTVQNVSLRCAHHNRHEGKQVFGTWEPDMVREAAAPYGGLPLRERDAQTRSGPSNRLLHHPT
jgi:HNH endonuclease